MANRIAEILENSTIDEWNFVNGLKNPADIGTRGMTISELNDSDWIKGPQWLTKSPEYWPEQPAVFNTTDDEVPEVVSCSSNVESLESSFDWTRYSSFSKLVNVIAFCLRTRFKSEKPQLTLAEKQFARKILLRTIQQESFGDEFKALKGGHSISSKSRIKRLLPFLDDENVMRLTGRLKHSNLSYEQKHPILLDAKHPVTKLLLLHEHQQSNHEGTEYVRSIIQHQFWIVGLRNALRSVKYHCITCRKRDAETLKPQMANLPAKRINAYVAPFTHTGVDYFGPFEVKLLRRTMKRWCCLFTCLSTRAVHIEVVHSLDTESCLAAVTKFIARRGRPKTLLSDNGSNFVGSARELKQYIDNWNKTQIAERLHQQDIEWSFNPPGAPHFGGVWERLVRSCKRAMFAVLSGRGLTDEILTTTMCIVEHTLNGRPLTPVSSDPEDLEAITPNHFLIGRAGICIPFIPQAEKYTDLRKAFRASQAYALMIWKRWSNEYLPQWNQRKKWSNQEKRTISEGDLVWLVDESAKRCDYKMARVVDVHPGSDGEVRAATIRTVEGVYKRPVVKLAPVFFDSCFQTKNRAGDVGAT